MISIRNLSLTIHGTPILHDVDLDIAAGRITGLVGESGSGKSLTAMALMGLLPRGTRTTGTALLDDTNLLTLPDPTHTKLRGNDIGMIFQEPMTALNPTQTIGHQVAETLTIHTEISRREALQTARDRLDRVGLSQIPLDRFPHELSGGQRQRVCIAMAIALRPRLLIADEPTTALDVTTQAQILDLLRDLTRSEGMALLLITHDLGVIAQMADHTAVLEKGRIVEQGPTEALFREMQHPYTRALLQAAQPAPRPARHISPDPVLRAQNVTREYPRKRTRLFGPKPPALRAVENLGFTLHRNECLGLVGESGCGKSTLTRALLGLEPVQSGTIQLSNISVNPAMAFADRAGISVVFQDPYGSFNPRWTVADLVSEPFHLTGKPRDWRDRVATALTQVGLQPTDMIKFPHEFSGGQRQRIAIARALITEPKVVILDEAVSALDVRVRAQVLDLLKDLQDRLGLSYLFITHDLSVVRAIADRVLVMQAGRIVEHGPTPQVFENPQETYTKTLIDAAPVIPPNWLRQGEDL